MGNSSFLQQYCHALSIQSFRNATRRWNIISVMEFAVCFSVKSAGERERERGRQTSGEPGQCRNALVRGR